MDPRTDRVELEPEDQAYLAAVVELLRSAKAISVLITLRRALTREEIEQVGRMLVDPRGQSGRW